MLARTIQIRSNRLINKKVLSLAIKLLKLTKKCLKLLKGKPILAQMFILIEDAEVAEVVEVIFNVISKKQELSTKTRKMNLLKDNLKNLIMMSLKEVEISEAFVVVVVKKEEIRDRKVIPSLHSLIYSKKIKMKVRIIKKTRQLMKKNNLILKLKNDKTKDKKRHLNRIISFLKSAKMKEINRIVKLM
jgi:hypothetical protein